MRNENQRLKLEMSIKESIMALAEGNPGALRVCSEIFTKTPSIDPNAFGGGLGGLLSLDACGIYGSRIWMFYKDVCKESIPNMLAVMRADQLGQLAGVTFDKINHAIDNWGEGIDLDATMKAVQERLPAFNKDALSYPDEA